MLRWRRPQHHDSLAIGSCSPARRLRCPTSRRMPRNLLNQAEATALPIAGSGHEFGADFLPPLYSLLDAHGRIDSALIDLHGLVM